MVKENLLKLDSNYHIIVNATVASIYRKPDFSSELITQALIWEKLSVINKENNWYKVKQRDGYEGWIHLFYIIDSSEYDNNKLLQDRKNWYWVRNKFLNLSLDNKQSFLISYGSLIPCFEDNNSFFTILPDSREPIKINRESLISCTSKIAYKENIKNSVKELIGLPYLWGGKSSFGFDCSGLLQSIINTSNFKFFQRDASQQVLSDMLVQKNNAPEVGNIIFFKMGEKVDHVGLYINDKEFIHSSGYVRINSIDKENKYYSSKLEVNLYGLYEINIKS